MLISLKVEHTVYHMLQYLRTRNGSLFVDVANHKNGHIFCFGQIHQCGGTLFHLADAAGSSLRAADAHRLNGVNN